MTISLVAVFIPVLFLGGIVGRLLHEFSVTIVVAILISGFVSLSLTPMLGSRFLKPEHEARHGVCLPRYWKAASTCWRAGTNARCASPCASSLATLAVAIADAGRHGLPVRDHAHRLHSQPGQRLHVRRHHWARRIFRSNRWRAHAHAVGDIFRANPEIADVGVFVPGGRP